MGQPMAETANSMTAEAAPVLLFFMGTTARKQ